MMTWAPSLLFTPVSDQPACWIVTMEYDSQSPAQRRVRRTLLRLAGRRSEPDDPAHRQSPNSSGSRTPR